MACDLISNDENNPSNHAPNNNPGLHAAQEDRSESFCLVSILSRVTDENVAHFVLRAFTQKSCRNNSRGDRVGKVMTSRQGPWSNISSGKVQPGLGRRSLCNHKQRLPEKRQVHHMSVERRRELFMRYLA